MPSLFAEFLQVFPSKRKACGGFMEMKWNHFYFVVKHLYLVLLFKYLFSCLLHFQTDIVQPWKALKYALNLKSFPCIRGPEEIGVKYCWCCTTVGTFKKHGFYSVAMQTTHVPFLVSFSNSLIAVCHFWATCDCCR